MHISKGSEGRGVAVVIVIPTYLSKCDGRSVNAVWLEGCKSKSYKAGEHWLAVEGISKGKS